MTSRISRVAGIASAVCRAQPYEWRFVLLERVGEVNDQGGSAFGCCGSGAMDALSLPSQAYGAPLAPKVCSRLPIVMTPSHPKMRRYLMCTLQSVSSHEF